MKNTLTKSNANLERLKDLEFKEIFSMKLDDLTLKSYLNELFIIIEQLDISELKKWSALYNTMMLKYHGITQDNSLYKKLYKFVFSLDFSVREIYILELNIHQANYSSSNSDLAVYYRNVSFDTYKSLFKNNPSRWVHPLLDASIYQRNHNIHYNFEAFCIDKYIETLNIVSEKYLNEKEDWGLIYFEYLYKIISNVFFSSNTILHDKKKIEIIYDYTFLGMKVIFTREKSIDLNKFMLILKSLSTSYKSMNLYKKSIDVLNFILEITSLDKTFVFMELSINYDYINENNLSAYYAKKYFTVIKEEDIYATINIENITQILKDILWMYATYRRSSLILKDEKIIVDTLKLSKNIKKYLHALLKEQYSIIINDILEILAEVSLDTSSAKEKLYLLQEIL